MALSGVPVTSKKRKRDDQDGLKERRQKVQEKSARGDQEEHIARLEKEIQDSQKHYNNLVLLLQLAQQESSQDNSKYSAIVSLCRAFCRFFVDGRMNRSKKSSQNEIVIVKWVNDRFSEFKDILSTLLNSPDAGRQIFAMALFMRLVNEEVSATKSAADQAWQTGTFSFMMRQLLEAPEGETVSQTFVEKYASPFDDVRHWTLALIPRCLNGKQSSTNYGHVVANSLTILSLIEPHNGEGQKLRNPLCKSLEKSKQPSLQSSTHRKYAQQAWLSLMKAQLEKNQRKRILSIMVQRVVPWFHKPEILMDFLVDSLSEEGAASLLSLSGLFYLMQEKNLDYPDFYTKLYSLLDLDLLHSKHRSRFFRLLNTFTSSTHLPAALVASFIKRMARLSLHSPPAGILAVVPWVYNLLKSHPSCTFMIHREPRCDEEREYNKAFGAEDPFEMSEPDPNKTGAIDSCLWELHALQRHYHPNVASVAKIISQQFTKQSYTLEDFLDYSYSSLIDMELGKELRKEPVVEFQIPRKVFSMPEEDGRVEQLLANIFTNS